ncbi:MAG: hypothetical protein NZZ41_07745 [Candidatus Dojkabacteria bacterium]|nr:hypothetical protein [Candidatus Dojkabacteria bacterium]
MSLYNIITQVYPEHKHEKLKEYIENTKEDVVKYLVQELAKIDLSDDLEIKFSNEK